MKGGTIKFMQDEALRRFHALATWPLFLITTAGEEEPSIAGFIKIFVDRVRAALAAEERAAVALEAEAAPALLGVFNGACAAYTKGT